MKTIRYVTILMTLVHFVVVDVIASFEPFFYEDSPSEVGENFQNTFEAMESSSALNTQEDSNFKENGSAGNLSTGFEVQDVEKAKEVSTDFQSTGPEVEDRVLTDIQKKSQKILEERLAEDSRKQQMLMLLQEQEYLKMQQKIWKTFEAKANRFGQKQKSSSLQQQRLSQAQSLLGQLQASKNALLEKDKLANDLALKLAKINAQRIATAQRLQVQKAARRSLSGSADSKTKQGSAQLMQARNQEQINTEQFMRLDKQFNIVNGELQNVRNEAESLRAQFQKIQQAIDQQLVQSSAKEEAY